jgi:hypothetical protein
MDGERNPKQRATGLPHSSIPRCYINPAMPTQKPLFSIRATLFLYRRFR